MSNNLVISVILCAKPHLMKGCDGPQNLLYNISQWWVHFQNAIEPS